MFPRVHTVFAKNGSGFLPGGLIEMSDEIIVPVGVYRSAASNDIMIGFSDGTAEEWHDVELDVRKAANRATRGLFPSGTDWYTKINDDHIKGVYDDNQRGGSDSGSDQDDQEQNQNGDGNEDGDGSQDQQGSDGDDGESDGDGDDGDSESDDSGDGDSDSEDGEMNFEDRDKDGEDDGFPENPVADALWELYRPRVREIAHHYAEYGARYALQHGKGGNGSGPGLTLQFDKGKVGKVEGVTHHMFPKVLAAVQRGVNVYLPGPPGTGKSHMAQQIAEALGVDFNVDSFSPMSTEAKLLGFKNAQGEPVRTGFQRVYTEGGVELFDEMDNANGAVLAVMNGGLANGQLGFSEGVMKRHENFVAIATANTLGTGPTAEFAGRQKIDPATLNRFVKIFIDTDENMEDHIIRSMIGATTGDSWLKKVRQVRRAVADLRIKHFVTMRDSINGARLIAPGAGAFSQLEALEHTILAVLTEDQVSKIKQWRG